MKALRPRASSLRKLGGVSAWLGCAAFGIAGGAQGQTPPRGAAPAAPNLPLNYPVEWRPLVDEFALRLRRDYSRIRPRSDAAASGQDADGIFDEIARSQAEVGEIATAKARLKVSLGYPFPLSRWIAANQALAGDAEGTETISHQGQTSEPDYLFLGQMWARAGDNGRSAANFELARLQATDADYGEGRAKYLGSLIEAEIAAHQPACAQAAIADVLEVARKAPNSALRVWIYNSAARFEAAIGDVNGARGTVAAALQAALGMPEALWRSGALSEIAFYQIVWGSPQYPTALFRQALDAALQIPEIDARDASLLHVTGVVRAAAFAANQAPTPEWRDGILGFDAQAARAIGDRDQLQKALKNLFFAEVKWGNAVTAAATFTEYRRKVLGLRDKGEDHIDAEGLDAMWESLSLAQANAGDFAAARRSLANIAALDAAKVMEAEAALAGAEARRGETAAAWRTASCVRSPEGQISAYLAVAEAQIASHSNPSVRKTFVECLRRTRASSDGRARFQFFERIGDLEVSAGDISAAKTSWNLARRAVPNMPAIGDSVQVRAYLSLADRQSRAGDREGAIITYRTVPSAISTAWEATDVARWLGHTALMQRRLGLKADAKATLDAADRIFATIQSRQPVRADLQFVRVVLAVAHDRSLIGDVSGTAVEIRWALRLAESDHSPWSSVYLEIVAAAVADIACPAALREPRQPDYLAGILLDEDARI